MMSFLSNTNRFHFVPPWTIQKIVEIQKNLVARKYLCIPAKSASSERLFSTAGNTVTDCRTCLNTDNVEEARSCILT